MKRFDIACERGHCHKNALSDRKTGEPEGINSVKELRLMIANCSQMTPISSKICVPKVYLARYLLYLAVCPTSSHMIYPSNTLL